MYCITRKYLSSIQRKLDAFYFAFFPGSQALKNDREYIVYQTLNEVSL